MNAKTKRAATFPVLETTTSTIARIAAHRRLMVAQGKHYLELLAASAAGAPYEPLPKRRR